MEEELDMILFEHIPPSEVGKISATEIRKKLFNK